MPCAISLKGTNWKKRAILGNETVKATTNDANLSRNYALTAGGVCYRTQVAMRTLTLNSRDWKRYLKGLSISEEACDESQVNVIIEKHILQVYQDAAEKALKALENMNDQSVKHQKEALVRRWTQIKSVVEQARHG